MQTATTHQIGRTVAAADGHATIESVTGDGTVTTTDGRSHSAGTYVVLGKAPSNDVWARIRSAA